MRAGIFPFYGLFVNIYRDIVADLYIEAEVHHIAVLYDVVLAFDT